MPITYTFAVERKGKKTALKPSESTAQCNDTTISQLTVDGRGHHHVEDLAPVAGVDQLIGAQRVEAQRAAARLVLCLHHHHHIETVAGKILPLDRDNKTEGDVRGRHVTLFMWRLLYDIYTAGF